jgi:large subunit ribosomal protein L24
MKKAHFSSKPGKVRKRLFRSGLQIKSSHQPRSALSSDLKSKYGRNSARVRVGDGVRLVRGEYSGIEGKVQKVFATEGLVTVEGITREKIAGGNSPVRIHSSNLIITNLVLDDKLRRERLEQAK